eukprot:TRINITY_DN7493_c0_g1_i7.p1 TRINITY_DN7493_c0_g1~~TRINITY_DN7493_c0_g1_i7.p1  ORF type:complete len:469 (-),score=68.32 TRINITY_DN7493_c0_g1_i7:105-1415(-)
MKQNSMPLLVLVLGLFGAWARKPNDQQELLAAPADAGLSGDSIAQIERSLLNLAQEQRNPDSSTLESIALIDSFIANMKQDILDRANSSQLAVSRSFQNLVNCKLNLTLETRENLSTLSAIHRECSAEESQLATNYKTCTDNCDTRCATAQASCGLYCPVNTPQPMPGNPVPSPTPSPTSCWYDTSQVKDDNAVGLYHEWEANQYYQKWEDNFQALYDEWKTKRDTCKDRVDELSSCWTNCASVHANAYERKKQECTEHQYDLETAACFGASRSCYAYQSCHASLVNIYLGDVASANASQSVWYDEYRGIMRVECLLDAFNASIISGASLTSALDACQARTFQPCTAVPRLCLQIYPLPETEQCNTTFVNGSVQPGSAEWIQTHYSNMPSKTTYEECGAQCCVHGPPATTITTTTALAPSSNCSLCCSSTDDWCVR